MIKVKQRRSKGHVGGLQKQGVIRHRVNIPQLVVIIVSKLIVLHLWFK